MKITWNLTSFDFFSKVNIKYDMHLLVHVLECILDNFKNSNFFSLLPEAEATPKQAGSETLARTLCHANQGQVIM